MRRSRRVRSLARSRIETRSRRRRGRSTRRRARRSSSLATSRSRRSPSTVAAPDHASWKGRSDDRLVASVEIWSQVCLTVEFAHSRDVIHRDIKPENVMVGGFGEVYLLDWGIATGAVADDPETLVGTPVYMA